METAINMAVGFFALLGALTAWAWACEQWIKRRRERREREQECAPPTHESLRKEIWESPDTPQRMP